MSNDVKFLRRKKLKVKLLLLFSSPVEEMGEFSSCSWLLSLEMKSLMQHQEDEWKRNQDWFEKVWRQSVLSTLGMWRQEEKKRQQKSYNHHHVHHRHQPLPDPRAGGEKKREREKCIERKRGGDEHQRDESKLWVKRVFGFEKKGLRGGKKVFNSGCWCNLLHLHETWWERRRNLSSPLFHLDSPPLLHMMFLLPYSSLDVQEGRTTSSLPFFAQNFLLITGETKITATVKWERERERENYCRASWSSSSSSSYGKTTGGSQII